MNQTGYEPGGSASTSGGTGAPDGKSELWTLEKCKKAYLDYLGSKTDEIEEQKNARRYYHGAQWTSEQIKALNKRKQPVVTFNRVGRKIDGVVGLIERLRQDPRAYARTPKHEEGADLATAVIRYMLDEQNWKAKSPEIARDAAIEGYGGLEIEISQGDQGDNEISFEIVEPDSFFYDPRSFRSDFSDARYMGVGKWLDVEAAIEMFPDKADDLRSSIDEGTDLTSAPDRDNKWYSESGKRKLVRMVDIWYRHKGKWCWTIFTGSTVLMEGESYLYDEKGNTACKFIMFSANIDQDGDRYGFIRNMRSAQDEYNARRSRALFMLQSRRLIVSQGAVDDIEKVRSEWARPDGVVEVPSGNVNETIKADDQQFDFAGQLKLMENAISELENYGPNQALVGDMQNQSGRAIQLLQQAGMAELGPYILSYRGWKLRVYRALFGAAQRHWSAERWIRVTDDEGLAQFVRINGVEADPVTGMPSMVNALGSLDVDIIIDESADAVNMQADAYDTLTVMAGKGSQIPPNVLIELSPLQYSVKKKLLDMMSQPDPAKQKAAEIELAGAAAKVDETKSKTALNMANARQAITPDAPQPGKPEKFELPPELQMAQAMADINETNASAMNKRSQAFKTDMDTTLAPQQAAHKRQVDFAALDQRQDQRQES